MDIIKKGKIWVYGDNVDTDVIIPARYLNTTNHRELAAHCMEDLDSGFAKTVNFGDMIVAGENFGCGSSREHAAIAIKESGVSVVIAKTFARIFYRNATNIGLPILECRDLVAYKGDDLEVNLASGEIFNKTNNKFYKATSFPESIQKLIQAGGLINYTREKLRVNSESLLT